MLSTIFVRDTIIDKEDVFFLEVTLSHKRMFFPVMISKKLVFEYF